MDHIYLSPPHMSQHERAFALGRVRLELDRPAGTARRRVREGVRRKGRRGRGRGPLVGDGGPAPGAALMGVGAGDEVITSSLRSRRRPTPSPTSALLPSLSTANGDLEHGSGPACRRSCGRPRRGKLPKAVVVVDLYGQCADYEPILEVCLPYHVPVIEDAAEALGPTYAGSPAGTFGSIGCFSVQRQQDHYGQRRRNAGHTTGTDYAKRARFLATQARDPAPTTNTRRSATTTA